MLEWKELHKSVVCLSLPTGRPSTPSPSINLCASEPSVSGLVHYHYNMEPEHNIRTLFASARAQRKQLEPLPDPTSALYQENLQSAIAALETCRKIADRISLFSRNETEEDISSGDLQ